MSELAYKPFSFQGEALGLYALDRHQWLPFDRLCRAFGLAPGSEWARARAHSALETRMERTPDNGDHLPLIMVESVPAWLFTVPTDSLPAHIRGKHHRFCKDLVGAVYDYATIGVAVNAEIHGPEARAKILDSIRQAAEFLNRSGASERDRLIAQSAIVSHLALEAGRDHKAELPITVASRIQGRGLRLAPHHVKAIGREMSQDYQRRKGKKPSTSEQIIDGAIRLVKSYRTEDAPALDRIIDDYMRRNRL